jgi:hypothetical protein
MRFDPGLGHQTAAHERKIHAQFKFLSAVGALCSVLVVAVMFVS